MTKEIKKATDGVSSAWLDAAWEKPSTLTVDDWFKELKEDMMDWGYWASSRTVGSRKRAKLLGLSPANSRRYLRPDRKLFTPGIEKEVKLSAWVRDDWKPPLKLRSQSRVIDVAPLKGCLPGSEIQFDIRDYFRPRISVDEIFFGEDHSVTTSVETEVGVGTKDYLLTRRGDLAVRVFARGGVGFSPPPCLL